VTAARKAKGRVVVTDDSPFMRKVIASSLTRCGFEIVASGRDGDEALELCRRHRPDAMTLDLNMPGTDGIAVLKELRREGLGIPVVVVSGFSPQHGARAVDALGQGAFELVSKPAAGEPLEAFFAELAQKVAAAAETVRGTTRRTAARPAFANGNGRAPHSASGRRVVLIVCSTGGPRALGQLLPDLPASVGDGVVIVQHMPPGFTGSLAQRLDGASKLTVREAGDEATVERGTALVAPGGSHLRIGADGKAHLSAAPAIGGLRPRADLTIEDAAKIYGERLLLVVLTGMGKDGLAGARVVKRRGGRVLVEAESSCTVYGMPRAISEAGLADAELDLARLATAVASEAGS
jgi:two-component system, chemotaxis family, protein-glutamate methylesterase/glutaminase